MLVHDNEVIVATNNNVYLMNDDKVMKKIVFEKEADPVCDSCGGSGMVETLKVSMACPTCRGNES